MRCAFVLLPLVFGCSMPHGAAIHSNAQDKPTSDATWRRVLAVPVLKVVGEFCDEVIYEDAEYRDCRLVNIEETCLLSGTPCGPLIRTTDHHWEADAFYVDGVQAPAPPHSWRHKFDDVRFLGNVSGKDANCREYVPPAGTKVWAVGYPAGDEDDDSGFDQREKIAIEGVVANDGGFHPDVVHIELNGFVSGGMSGGPVVAEVDGALVAFATIVSAPKYTIKPTSWLYWFQTTKGVYLRALLCRGDDAEGR